MMKRILSAFTILALLSLLFPASSFAVGSSGFENASYTGRSLGQGNAMAARAEDPSTIMFNPAGLVDLPGVQTNLGVALYDLRIYHRNNLTRDKTSNQPQLLEIPAFYLTANPGKKLDNRVAFGLAMNSPFGLTTYFPSVGMGRYEGWENYLQMLSSTFSGALKLTDKLSVGAGVTNHWAYKYGQKLNYPNGNILGIAAADGKADLTTNGYGWGWNFGALYKPTPKHRLGFSFRSKSDLNMHGQVKIDNIISPAAQGYDTGQNFVSGAHTQLHLPQNFTWAYAYVPSDKWAVEVDLGLTGWHIFKEQDYEFDRNNATLRGLGTVPRDYEDTVSVHLGGHRKINKKTDLLGGFFFYQAAAPKKHFDNFLPDSNRFGWAIGTSYNLTERARLDLSYIFILYARRYISNPQLPAKGGDNVDGRYTSILHGAFISFNYQFDFPGSKKKVKVDSAAAPVEITTHIK